MRFTERSCSTTKTFKKKAKTNSGATDGLRNAGRHIYPVESGRQTPNAQARHASLVDARATGVFH
jgi:hypothetical protein